jgi:hypothetical protein
MPADDRPFGCQATPIPDLTEEYLQKIEQEVMQEAIAFLAESGIEPSEEEMAERKEELLAAMKAQVNKKAREEAENLEQELFDVLEEADWRSSFKEFLYYFVTFPAAFLKGPVLRTKPCLKWEKGVAVVKDEIVKDVDAVSPFDIYPAPSSRGINDGYLIERHRLTRGDLY